MSKAGIIRAVAFFGILGLLPLGVKPQWVINLLIFTLMYATLASSWNLIGGYAGYPSLGHAAFFGFGKSDYVQQFSIENLIQTVAVICKRQLEQMLRR